MLGSGISLALVIAGSAALGLYAFRLLLIFLNPRKQAEDEMEERTSRLVRRYKSGRRSNIDDQTPAP